LHAVKKIETVQKKTSTLKLKQLSPKHFKCYRRKSLHIYTLIVHFVIEVQIYTSEVYKTNVKAAGFTTIVNILYKQTINAI